jgi:hypothetical protein
MDISNAYKIIYLQYLEYENSGLTLQIIPKNLSPPTRPHTWPLHQQGCDKILTAIKTIKFHNVIKTAGLPTEILTRDFQYTKQFSCNFIG